MTGDEARGCFADARVAVLGTTGGAGRPHLVPVVFAVRGDEVVTAVDHKPKRSAALRRLDNIAAHREVCLLVQAYHDDWDRLWWVRADGDARILPPDAPDDATRQRYSAAIAALRERYAPYRRQPPGGPVISVAVRRWHGWRAADRPADPPRA